MKTEQSDKFSYKIGFETISVGKIRHNKIQSGYTGYSVRGCGTITAKHWEGFAHAQRRAPVAMPEGFKQLQDLGMLEPVKAIKTPQMFPELTKPQSKADIVRAQISIMKNAGYDMQQCMAAGGHLLYTIAKAANMKEALCKTYIKNNWSK
jgi:hypothetical protein